MRAVEIRELGREELGAARELVRQSFCQFVAPDYGEEGVQSFLAFLERPDLMEAAAFSGAFVREGLAGVLAVMEKERHVCLLFVRADCQRRGIGKALWEHYRGKHLRERCTVNASPFGLGFYFDLGFVPTGPEQIQDGIRYTPMEIPPSRRPERMVYSCPCCGRPTFPVPPGAAIAYICPVCWWENDVFLHSDTEPSDENHGLTLREGRENFRGYGICDPRLTDRVGNMGWQDVVREYASTAGRFEVHCWREEQEALALLLPFGQEEETDWQYGFVVAGDITGDFLEVVLSQPVPEDQDPFRKLTPFFSIFFDNGFSSAHWGTELHFPG